MSICSVDHRYSGEKPGEKGSAKEIEAGSAPGDTVMVVNSWRNDPKSRIELKFLSLRNGKYNRRTKMASLKSQLNDVLKVEGVSAAVIVGRDGFVIEGLSNDGNLDVEAVVP